MTLFITYDSVINALYIAYVYSRRPKKERVYLKCERMWHGDRFMH
jgi:hypothetical protein